MLKVKKRLSLSGSDWTQLAAHLKTTQALPPLPSQVRSSSTELLAAITSGVVRILWAPSGICAKPADAEIRPSANSVSVGGRVNGWNRCGDMEISELARRMR